MRIRYTVRARADLQEIRSYLLPRNPRAAVAVVTAIGTRISWLADFPLMAPETDEPGVRALPLVRYPYRVSTTRLLATKCGSSRSAILEGDLGGKCGKRVLPGGRAQIYRMASAHGLGRKDCAAVYRFLAPSRDEAPV